MLKFDAETTRFLELAYQGADIARRRRASFDALGPEPGDVILDIGCGNGLLAIDLARAVGPEGRIVGVDPSGDMRAAAEKRLEAFSWVDVVDGTANALPLEGAVADKAVSLQVFEYLEDLPGAAREAARVLKQGGLLVIGDMHFDSLLWFSERPERMRRMMASWDQHLSERSVPAILPPILRDTGFTVENLRPVTFCDHVLRPDGIAGMMMRLMERYAVDNGHLSADEARAWSEEQRALAADGRFFFSLTHFVISARKM